MQEVKNCVENSKTVEKN